MATAITPMAFYETVMAKGYETLVHPNTKVDINTGMIAAGRLQAMIDSRAGQTDLPNIIVQVDRVIKAVHPRCRSICGARSWRSWSSRRSYLTRQITEPRDEQNGAEG